MSTVVYGFSFVFDWVDHGFGFTMIVLSWLFIAMSTVLACFHCLALFFIVWAAVLTLFFMVWSTVLVSFSWYCLWCWLVFHCVGYDLGFFPRGFVDGFDFVFIALPMCFLGLCSSLSYFSIGLSLVLCVSLCYCACVKQGQTMKAS